MRRDTRRSSFKQPAGSNAGRALGRRLSVSLLLLLGGSCAAAPSVAGADAAPAVTVAPPVVTSASTADVTGTVNPQGDPTTTWQLQTSAEPACEFFLEGPTHELESEANSPVAVSEELTELAPSQHYCVRISATNSTGTETSETVEFETQPAPLSDVEPAFVAPRTDVAARLNGRVNPRGSAFTFHFEYSADGGNTWSVLPNHNHDAGERRQIIVSQELTGLSPGTTYSYRFIAENAVGPAPVGASLEFTTRTTAEVTDPACPNSAVRVAQHTTFLRECRGIELVNDPNKGNQNLASDPMLILVSGAKVSPAGDRALWMVLSGAPGAPNPTFNTFLAERGTDGWTSRAVAPSIGEETELGVAIAQPLAVTPDYSSFLLSGPGEVDVSLLRLRQGQPAELLKTYNTFNSGIGLDQTDDGSHALVVNPENRQLEDLGPQGAETVSIMPEGGVAPCGLEFEGQSFPGGGGPSGVARNWRPGYHAMNTDDASIVYFETQSADACGGPLGLYVRDRALARTTLIDPGAEGHGAFLIRSTPDGRHAYFTTYSQLDPVDGNLTADVYRWDLSSGDSHCLTCIVPNANVRELESPSPVLVSDDFSHIYFESENQLIPGKGTVGDGNLYAISDGEVRFVADPNIPLEEGEGALSRFRARLSADGESLVFRMRASATLTSDLIAPECAQVFSDSLGRCNEFYRYQEQGSEVECISCLTGGVTTSNTTEAFGASGDGSTVAFTSRGALLPRDVNKGADVYGWRDGRLSLLTDGTRNFARSRQGAPEPRGIDADGSNIFFSVQDPGRTGFELDGFSNLYDARIDGGFMPPGPALHCSEESCQGPLQAAPELQRAGSLTFIGPGNALRPPKRVRRAPCAKKRKKARLRCARKHRHAHGRKDAGRAK
jgi:hypothetical protein